LAFWFFEFFKDGWHVFDSAIVAVSLASIANEGMPAINSIRAVRVLRAVRLLKKSKTLAPIGIGRMCTFSHILKSHLCGTLW